MSLLVDLNTTQQLTMTLILKDDAGTVLHLCVPSKGTVDKVCVSLPKLKQALAGADESTSRAIYALTAELINNNLDGVTTTPRELATKYRMNLEDMAVFYAGYVDFLQAIENEKN